MNSPPQYPKGDLRRMLMILAILHQYKSATLVVLADKTGLAKKTVGDLIAAAGSQAGVEIEKIGPVYHLRNIGPLFKVEGLKLSLQGALNAPILSQSDQ